MKKYIYHFVIALFFLGQVLNCSTPKSNSINAEGADTTSINVKQAYKLIGDNKDNSNFVILDVRKPDDFQKEHINNAINIDFKSDNFSERLDSLDKNKTYLINCYGGFRSRNTMGMMEKKGFKKLYNMKGGFIKWRLKKLPVISAK